MKKIIILMLVILAATVQSSYANTDYPQTNNWTYECSAAGEGTLTLFFGGVGSKNAPNGQKHHIDKRTYRIDYPGIVTLYNTNRNYAHADIIASDGIKTTGCKKACELGPISGDQKIWPNGWSHKVQGWGQTPGDETSPDAYVYTGHWPNWVQARSGAYWVCGGGSCWLVYEAAGFGDTRTYSDGGIVGFGTTEITFTPTGNGMGNCAKCSSGINPATLHTSPVTPACDIGTLSNLTPTVDGGITTQRWTCDTGAGTPASCTAQSKPLCVPSATDGCCSETRLPSQCIYSINNADKMRWTEDGPVIIPINSTTNCRPPVDGKPNISCTADPFITISSTLSSFTLPSSVTQKPGSCIVSFSAAADVCKDKIPDRTDTISITPGVCDNKITDPKDPKFCGPNECDPTISDYADARYCPRTVTKGVCVEIKDGFGNLVKNYSTGSIVSVLGPVKSNPYFEKYNPGKDATIYQEGSYIEVDGTYCTPIICVKGDPRPECNPKCDPTITDKNNPKFCPCVAGDTRAVCLPGTCDLAITDPNNSKFCKCTTGDTRAICISPPPTCDPAITDPNNSKFCKCTTGDTRAICISPPPTCDPAITDPKDNRFCKCTTGDTRVACNVCIPTELNNYCNPPKCVDNPATTVDECNSCVDNPATTVDECIPTPTTVPGCGEVGYTGDPLECIPVNKSCTAYLEVKSDSTWIDSGDGILYDEPMQYRIRMRDTDPICRTGIISIQEITATGGVLSGAVSYQADGSFFATIKRSSASTPITARGPLIRALFTQPGGITYGLTDRADDFQDTPLSITGERMKGVRIIGNSAGTTVTNFNLNNGGVIGEETGPSVVAARNAMIKNAALLTRGVPPGDRVINGVYYVEGDILYSTVRAAGFKTLIVKGNLTIDENIGDINGSDAGVGIIVIRDSIGNKGNVVVTDTVTYIHALIFSEETFRGISQTAGVLNPKTQLVLKGTLFSRNTVGGYAELGKYYTSGGSPTTDPNLAFRQDLNNVRNGYGCQAGVTCTLYKGYKDPFIIDFDNMQSAPPPGFSN